MKSNDKVKAEILLLLKRKGELPTTNIAVQTKEQYWKIVAMLSELEDEKKVECNPTEYFKYWKLKN